MELNSSPADLIKEVESVLGMGNSLISNAIKEDIVGKDKVAPDVRLRAIRLCRNYYVGFLMGFGISAKAAWHASIVTSNICGGEYDFKKLPLYKYKYVKRKDALPYFLFEKIGEGYDMETNKFISLRTGVFVDENGNFDCTCGDLSCLLCHERRCYCVQEDIACYRVQKKIAVNWCSSSLSNLRMWLEGKENIYTIGYSNRKSDNADQGMLLGERVGCQNRDEENHMMSGNINLTHCVPVNKYGKLVISMSDNFEDPKSIDAGVDFLKKCDKFMEGNKDRLNLVYDMRRNYLLRCGPSLGSIILVEERRIKEQLESDVNYGIKKATDVGPIHKGYVNSFLDEYYAFSLPLEIGNLDSKQVVKNADRLAHYDRVGDYRRRIMKKISAEHLITRMVDGKSPDNEYWHEKLLRVLEDTLKVTQSFTNWFIFLSTIGVSELCPAIYGLYEGDAVCEMLYFLAKKAGGATCFDDTGQILFMKIVYNMLWKNRRKYDERLRHESVYGHETIVPVHIDRLINLADVNSSPTSSFTSKPPNWYVMEMNQRTKAGQEYETFLKDKDKYPSILVAFPEVNDSIVIAMLQSAIKYGRKILFCPKMSGSSEVDYIFMHQFDGPDRNRFLDFALSPGVWDRGRYAQLQYAYCTDKTLKEYSTAGWDVISREWDQEKKSNVRRKNTKVDLTYEHFKKIVSGLAIKTVAV